MLLSRLLCSDPDHWLMMQRVIRLMFCIQGTFTWTFQRSWMSSCKLLITQRYWRTNIDTDYILRQVLRLNGTSKNGRYASITVSISVLHSLQYFISKLYAGTRSVYNLMTKKTILEAYDNWRLFDKIGLPLICKRLSTRKKASQYRLKARDH